MNRVSKSTGRDKKWSLRRRMIFLTVGIAMFAVGLVVTVQSIISIRQTKEEGFARTKSIAGEQAISVQLRLSIAMDTARALANTFESLKANKSTSRKIFRQILQGAITGSKDFHSIWTCWEPLAFDGDNDESFKGAEAHDDTGRFIPCYTQAASDKSDALPEVAARTDYKNETSPYAIAIKNGEEILTDPYIYKSSKESIRVVSIAVPIKFEGKPVGVIGIDIPAESFQAQISAIQPYGKGWATLLSNSGEFIAHKDIDRIGKNFLEFGDRALRQEILSSVIGGKTFSAVENDSQRKMRVVRYYLPIEIGKAKQKWVLNINAPEAQIKAAAFKTIEITIIIGVCACFIAMILGLWFAKMISRALSGIIRDLADGSDNVSSASEQMSTSSQSIADGASTQASSLEETSASLEQMASITKQNADNAKQSDTMASETMDAAKHGQEAMERMNEAIRKIQDSSNQTAKILKSINEIAFQTNLLALNAAVEAARAGESGKGFAVVAEEVRSLAKRSAEAARTTASLIEESLRNAEGGVIASGEVAQFLLRIVESSGKVTTIIKEVANASEEQSKGIDQVNMAVSHMDQVVQTNASSAVDSASTAQQLNTQAAELKQKVDLLSQILR